MPRIKLRYSINSSTDNISEEVNGILKEEELIYNELPSTKVNYNYKNNTLKRENDNFLMEYKFINKKNSTGKYLIKYLNKCIELPIKTKKIEKINNNIEITYIIDNEEITYKIEVLE